MRALTELDGAGVRAHEEALAEVLHDCVQHGASVGFVLPFSHEDARQFWRAVAAKVEAGARRLFVARDGDGQVCGTVQLSLDMPPNGAHRAEITKLLVHSRARRLGLARALMLEAERCAREQGRTLLVLDTWTGSGAEQLYLQLGFRLAGVIPSYARTGDGALGATSVMYKELPPPLRVQPEDPASSDAAALMDELSAALAAITGDSGRASFSVDDVRGPAARFVVARDAQGRALGCGALRPFADGVAEVKRMYSRPGSRGVGSAVLAFLEAEATALGYRALWLETRAVNARAVAFYERRGYQRIENYGKYVGNAEAVCFEKRLG